MAVCVAHDLAAGHVARCDMDGLPETQCTSIRDASAGCGLAASTACLLPPPSDDQPVDWNRTLAANAGFQPSRVQPTLN
eukprot:363596-Chlamydomonas_euryale.AAC.7